MPFTKNLAQLGTLFHFDNVSKEKVLLRRQKQITVM